MSAIDLPGWLIFVLGVVVGALGILVIGPASDAYWEAVYAVRRFCLIVGVCVVVLVVVGGVGYLVWYFASASPSS